MLTNQLKRCKIVKKNCANLQHHSEIHGMCTNLWNSWLPWLPRKIYSLNY